MNIKGSHFKISASMRGEEGLRAKLSKKVSYRRIKDGLFSLYLVQLHHQLGDQTRSCNLLDIPEIQLYQPICHPPAGNTSN